MQKLHLNFLNLKFKICKRPPAKKNSLLFRIFLDFFRFLSLLSVDTRQSLCRVPEK